MINTKAVTAAGVTFTGGISEEVRTSTITNLGTTDVMLNSTGLEDTASTDWSIIIAPAAGELLAAGDSAAVTIRYRPVSRRSSNNRLIIQTSVGTATQTLQGNFVSFPDGDGDGVSDDVESGPAHTYAAYDGNCDGQPDREQVNVVSLDTATGDAEPGPGGR